MLNKAELDHQANAAVNPGFQVFSGTSEILSKLKIICNRFTDTI
jgi:hypothetical protein